MEDIEGGTLAGVSRVPGNVAQVGGAVGLRPKDLTRAFLGLCRAGHETGLDALLSSAADAVDAYLTPNAEDSVFDEPAFRNNFNNNLNGYLKWEQLGKSEVSSPRLRSLLGGYKRTLGFKRGDQPTLRDLITAAAREV